MPKYKVTVIRTSYASGTIEVEADNKKQAKQVALEEAGNHSYSGYDADYEILEVEEIDG